MISKWDALCAQYVEQSQKEKVSQKAFCEAQGINQNTFRRQLGSYKSRLEKGEVDTAEKADHKPKEKVIKKVTDKKVTTKKGTTNKEPVVSKVESKKSTREYRKKAPKVNPKKYQEKRIGHNATRSNDYNDGMRSFKKNHDTNVIHGAHAKLLFGEDESLRDFTQGTLGDISALLTARVMKMDVIRNARISAIKTNYENGKLHLREVMNEEGDIEKIPMSFDEAINDVMNSGLELYIKLSKEATNAKEKLAKIQQAQYNASVNSASETVELTAQLLHHRVQNELTAEETCNLFYSNGLTPPLLLMKEAEIEISKGEGENDNEGGVTNEDLEVSRIKARDRRANKDEWLRIRTMENEEMLAGLGGFGSEQITESE